MHSINDQWLSYIACMSGWQHPSLRILLPSCDRGWCVGVGEVMETLTRCLASIIIPSELCSAPAQCHSCRRRPAHRDTWRRGVALDTGHTGHRVSSSTVNIHNNTHHWYHKHSIQHDTRYIGILIVVNASYPNRFEVTILCKHIFDRFLRKTPGLHSIYSTVSTSTLR